MKIVTGGIAELSFTAVLLCPRHRPVWQRAPYIDAGRDACSAVRNALM